MTPVAELNTLLQENRKEMSELIVNANRLASEAGDVLEKVDDGMGYPRAIARTIRNADALLVQTNKTVSTLTPSAKSLLDDAARATSVVTAERVDRALKVADRAVTVAGKAGGLIDNVNGMVTDLRAGKGTAGALLAREELYADLREMIRDLKRNPWKFFWKE